VKIVGSATLRIASPPGGGSPLIRFVSPPDPLEFGASTAAPSDLAFVQYLGDPPDFQVVDSNGSSWPSRIG
jgi:hypothetical protein